MYVSKLTVRRITKLSMLKIKRHRIGITKLKVIQKDLKQLTKYFNQLKLINTDNIEPLIYPFKLQNVLRNDNIKSSLPINDIFSNAPIVNNNYFVIPKIY